MNRRWKVVVIHGVLVGFAALTLLPFAFSVNNMFRSSREFYQSFFSFPDAVEGLVEVAWRYASGEAGPMEVESSDGARFVVERGEAWGHYVERLLEGPETAWRLVRPYLLNSLIVSTLTALGVCLLGSAAAYIFARYRFMGRDALFMVFLATMMVPGVLTLVPSFMLVRELGLMNTYWAMILPYIAGGQVFAIFVFRSFFSGLPEELFESARMDGAGHLSIYYNIVLPLSKPVFSVVIIMNVLGTWNNFLWPFVTNTDGSKHVIASGLFTLARSGDGSNLSTMYSGYAFSSIPLLILFLFATKPFMSGITRGALKA